MSSISDQQLIEDFLDDRETQRDISSAGTREEYRRDIQRFADHLERRGLLEARRRDLVAWFKENTRTGTRSPDNRPWSPRTAARKAAALSSFYGWAVETGKLEQDPTDNFRIRAQTTQKLPVRLSREVIGQIFAYVEEQIEAHEPPKSHFYLLDLVIYRMCYNWALRISEALNIRVQDISQGEEASRTMVYVRKKGNKHRRYPLTGVVREAVYRWEKVRTSIAPATHEDAGLLFLHPRHGGAVTRSRSWRRLKKIGQALELSDEQQKHLTPHALRHAMGYHTVEEQGLQAAQAILDHANISTTNVYVRPGEEERMSALRRAASGE